MHARQGSGVEFDSDVGVAFTGASDRNQGYAILLCEQGIAGSNLFARDMSPKIGR